MAVLKILFLFSLLILTQTRPSSCDPTEDYYSSTEALDQNSINTSPADQLTHVPARNLNGQVKLNTLEVLNDLNKTLQNEEETTDEIPSFSENKQIGTITENQQKVSLLSSAGTKALTDGLEPFALMDVVNDTSGTLPDQTTTEKLITVTPLNFRLIQAEGKKSKESGGKSHKSVNEDKFSAPEIIEKGMGVARSAEEIENLSTFMDVDEDLLKEVGEEKEGNVEEGIEDVAVIMGKYKEDEMSAEVTTTSKSEEINEEKIFVGLNTATELATTTKSFLDEDVLRESIVIKKKSFEITENINFATEFLTENIRDETTTNSISTIYEEILEKHRVLQEEIKDSVTVAQTTENVFVNGVSTKEEFKNIEISTKNTFLGSPFEDKTTELDSTALEDINETVVTREENFKSSKNFEDGISTTEHIRSTSIVPTTFETFFMGNQDLTTHEKDKDSLTSIATTQESYAEETTYKNIFETTEIFTQDTFYASQFEDVSTETESVKLQKNGETLSEADSTTEKIKATETFTFGFTSTEIFRKKNNEKENFVVPTTTVEIFAQDKTTEFEGTSKATDIVATSFSREASTSSPTVRSEEKEENIFLESLENNVTEANNGKVFIESKILLTKEKGNITEVFTENDKLSRKENSEEIITSQGKQKEDSTDRVVQILRDLEKSTEKVETSKEDIVQSTTTGTGFYRTVTEEYQTEANKKVTDDPDIIVTTDMSVEKNATEHFMTPKHTEGEDEDLNLVITTEMSSSFTPEEENTIKHFMPHIHSEEEKQEDYDDVEEEEKNVTPNTSDIIFPTDLNETEEINEITTKKYGLLNYLASGVTNFFGSLIESAEEKIKENLVPDGDKNVEESDKISYEETIVPNIEETNVFKEILAVEDDEEDRFIDLKNELFEKETITTTLHPAIQKLATMADSLVNFLQSDENEKPEISVKINGREVKTTIKVITDNDSFFVPADAFQIHTPNSLNITWKSPTPYLNNSLQLVGNSLRLNIVKGSEMHIYKINKYDADTNLITLDEGVGIYFSNGDILNYDKRIESASSEIKLVKNFTVEIIVGCVGALFIIIGSVYYVVRRGKRRDFKPETESA